jgi:hypothetical protein
MPTVPVGMAPMIQHLDHATSLPVAVIPEPATRDIVLRGTARRLLDPTIQRIRRNLQLSIGKLLDVFCFQLRPYLLTEHSAVNIILNGDAYSIFHIDLDQETSYVRQQDWR